MTRLNVLVACGAGMGSSQMLKMVAKKVFDKMGLDVKIDHCAIDEARSSARNYDVLLCNDRFVDTIKADKVKVIGLKNVLDQNEIKEKLLAAGIGAE